MSIFTKAIHRLKAICIKIPNAFFLNRRRKLIIKLTQNHKRLPTAKAILRKKYKAGGVTFSDFNFYYKARVIKGLPHWLSGIESACQCRRRGFDHWVRKSPWRKKWQLTVIFLPGKSHGQRSLAGYSPWGRQELNMTYWLKNIVIQSSASIKTDRLNNGTESRVQK